MLPAVVDSVSVDATGMFAVLGARDGLHIVDLERPVEFSSSFGSGAVTARYNPHASYAHVIAATSGDRVQVWSVDDDGSRVHTDLAPPHEQGDVVDLSWSVSRPYQLASCGPMAPLCLWDVRDMSSPTTLVEAVSAAHLAWCRTNEHYVAGQARPCTTCGLSVAAFQ